MKKYISIFIIFAVLFSVGVKVYAEQKLSPALISCMQDAVEKRDTAIITGVTAFSASVTKALEVRKEAIKNSWTIELVKDREVARKTTWDEYHKNAGVAKQTLKDARLKAWEIFRADKKSCSLNIPEATKTQ